MRPASGPHFLFDINQAQFPFDVNLSDSQTDVIKYQKDSGRAGMTETVPIRKIVSLQRSVS
jgi:hypothetical protein